MHQTCYNCHGHGCSYCGGSGKEDDEKKDFDYWKPDELDEQMFAKYRGNIYDISQFMRLTFSMTVERIRNGTFHPFGREWDYGGYHSDSFYSGILCLIVDDETVRMATYMS